MAPAPERLARPLPGVPGAWVSGLEPDSRQTYFYSIATGEYRWDPSEGASPLSAAEAAARARGGPIELALSGGGGSGGSGGATERGRRRRELEESAAGAALLAGQEDKFDLIRRAKKVRARVQFHAHVQNHSIICGMATL